jgi:hypothetical protein
MVHTLALGARSQATVNGAAIFEEREGTHRCLKTSRL